jgi:uncharacterized damage-inducible protein DinB
VNENEIKRIVKQFTASMEGNAWHGPAVFELLNDINDEEASQRALRDAHNIYEIAAHIITWQKAGIRRIKGDASEITEQEDWPVANDATTEQWSVIKKALQSVYNELKGELEKFSAERLNENIPGKEQTFYTLFHGIIQHNIYHAGQIAMLKKAIRTSYI